MESTEPGITVTVGSGNDSVKSVTSEDAIELDGGSLTIASASTINNTLIVESGILTVGDTLGVNGSFDLGNGIALSGGGTIDANGPATLAGANRIFGTTLNLHGATTWNIAAPNQFLFAGAQVNILPTAVVSMVGSVSELDDGDNTAVAINNQER